MRKLIMRELERRLRVLEETRHAADAPPARGLRRFYEAYWAVDDPDHDHTVRSLDRFYGTLCPTDGKKEQHP
jgi:hypothetical protein